MYDEYDDEPQHVVVETYDHYQARMAEERERQRVKSLHFAVMFGIMILLFVLWMYNMPWVT